MLRRYGLVLALLPSLVRFAAAAPLPDRFGSHTKTADSAAAAEGPLWKEYGLQQGAAATYDGKIQVTAYRFADPTGAAAAFDWQRPAGAARTATANLSVAFRGGALVAFGNYLLRFDGWQPRSDELVPLVQALPGVRRGALPYVRGALPTDRSRVAASERYILGPASLAAFEPRIPASIAGFEQSAEAVYGRYRKGSGEAAVLVFMYPTHQMARSQVAHFEKLPGVAVRRSGPLVGVALPAEASGLLAGLNYQAEYTETQHVPKDTVQDAAQMILAIALLAIGLILASVLLGFGFGAVRVLARRFGISFADDSFTGLDLSGK